MLIAASFPAEVVLIPLSPHPVSSPEGFEPLLLFIACETYPSAVRCLVTESINLSMGAANRVGEAQITDEDHSWRFEEPSRAVGDLVAIQNGKSTLIYPNRAS